MKNTNITLAMVAVLAAVAMLSAGLAVPMQQASAWSERDGSDGGNSFESDTDIDQEQECRASDCEQTATVTNNQEIREMGPE